MMWVCEHERFGAVVRCFQIVTHVREKEKKKREKRRKRKKMFGDWRRLM